jgi:hypothetical protein
MHKTCMEILVLRVQGVDDGKVRYHKRAVGHENPPSWYRKAVSG